MPVLWIFLQFYLWQSISVRNLPRDYGVCSTETVAGGRGLCKLSYKACCSGKCVFRAFWYLFLNPLPLILITNLLAYFLQAQLFPGISFFLLWWISTVNGCGHVTKSGCTEQPLLQIKAASCEWFHILLLCWSGQTSHVCNPGQRYHVCSAFGTHLIHYSLKEFPSFWIPGCQVSRKAASWFFPIFLGCYMEFLQNKCVPSGYPHWTCVFLILSLCKIQEFPCWILALAGGS